MAKRSGVGLLPGGLSNAPPGSFAVVCPACPPSKEVEDDCADMPELEDVEDSDDDDDDIDDDDGLNGVLPTSEVSVPFLDSVLLLRPSPSSSLCLGPGLHTRRPQTLYLATR